MWMVGRHDQFLGGGLHLVLGPFHPYLEQTGPLAAIDRQHAVRGHAVDMLREIEVVAVVLGVFRCRLALDLHPLAPQPAGATEDAAKPLPQGSPLTEVMCDDVPHAQQGIGNRCHLHVGIDEVGRPRVEVGSGRVGREDFPSQWLQPPLTGDLG